MPNATVSRACLVSELPNELVVLARNHLSEGEAVRYCWHTNYMPPKPTGLFGPARPSGSSRVASHYGYLITDQSLIAVSRSDDLQPNMLLDESIVVRHENIAEILEEHEGVLVRTRAGCTQLALRR